MIPARQVSTQTMRKGFATVELHGVANPRSRRRAIMYKLESSRALQRALDYLTFLKKQARAKALV